MVDTVPVSCDWVEYHIYMRYGTSVWWEIKWIWVCTSTTGLTPTVVYSNKSLGNGVKPF